MSTCVLIAAVLMTSYSFAVTSLMAQQRSALTVGIHAERATMKTGAALDSTKSARPRHVLYGTLIGAAVGTVTGIVVAAEINSRPHLDHSEDGLAYFFFTLTGAGLGIVIGAIVGFFWR